MAGQALQTEFDYHFTEKELTDLLQYIQSDPPEKLTSLPVPSFFPESGNPPSLSLQFHPHPPLVLGIPANSSPGLVADQAPLSLYTSAADLPGTITPPPDSTVGIGLSRTPPLNANTKKGDHKSSKESHSTVEKQRRDRINSLIDELRDLVPAQNAGVAVNEEVKRPKHVVLSDTIALVKELQGKAKSEDTGKAESQEQQSENRNKADVLVKSEEVSADAPQDFKQLGSEKLLEGVTIEEDGGVNRHLRLRVVCKDRRGLLLDLIAVLKPLPVQIIGASVRTMSDGLVHDVFSVEVDTEHEERKQEVKCQMLEKLKGLIGEGEPNEKRLKVI
eukprot:jgi/Botrbrau1/2491/Bobra.0226s0048.1